MKYIRIHIQEEKAYQDQAGRVKMTLSAEVVAGNYPGRIVAQAVVFTDAGPEALPFALECLVETIRNPEPKREEIRYA